jgi:hypothetical protein
MRVSRGGRRLEVISYEVQGKGKNIRQVINLDRYIIERDISVGVTFEKKIKNTLNHLPYPNPFNPEVTFRSM